MLRHRLLRVTVASGLLTAVILTLYPYVFHYVSTSAVVNAPVVTVRSPFDGVITTPSGEISTAVAIQERLVIIAEDRSDQHIMNDLEAQVLATSGRLAALDLQRTALHRIRDQLLLRAKVQREHADAWLEARAVESTARIDTAMARLSEAEADRDRQRHLAASGALTQVAVRAAETQAEVAAGLVAAERASLARVMIARQAQLDGVPLNEGGEGLAQLIGRLDDLDLKLVELEQAHASLVAVRRGLEMQVAFNAERLRDREIFNPDAQFAGIIWKASPPAGTPILTGDEIVRLLDCTKRFVEVAVDERHFESIAPGETAAIRLKGSQSWLEARIVSVIGSQSRIDRPAFGAAHPSLDDRQLSVFLALPAADPSNPDVARAFCDVGRTAEVRFERSRNWADETGMRLRQGLSAVLPDLGG